MLGKDSGRCHPESFSHVIPPSLDSKTQVVQLLNPLVILPPFKTINVVVPLLDGSNHFTISLLDLFLRDLRKVKASGGNLSQGLLALLLFHALNVPHRRRNWQDDRDRCAVKCSPTLG